MTKISYIMLRKYHNTQLLRYFLAFFSSLSAYSQEATLRFQLPIKCTLNKTCWISRYMNIGTPKNPQDYQGGRLTDSTHNGIDFALQDLLQMKEGVEVLAVADGKVIGIRDNMPDEEITSMTLSGVNGKECGNGVMIDHGHNLKTQYCHLKLHSLKVKLNDQVKAGQTLGFVGISGLSEYPHLHLSTFYHDKRIDPFIGISNSHHPLWEDSVLKLMPYEAGKIYNIGITGEAPNILHFRQGQYRLPTSLTNPSQMIGCTEIFAVNQGDTLTLKLIDPNGNEKLSKTILAPKYYARYYAYAGIHKPKEGWVKGSWRFRVEYEEANQHHLHNREEIFTVQ